MKKQAIALKSMLKMKGNRRLSQIFDEAMTMVDLDKPVQVLARKVGILWRLGIVAGRIMGTNPVRR